MWIKILTPLLNFESFSASLMLTVYIRIKRDNINSKVKLVPCISNLIFITILFIT